jgi:hypothetical protein
MNKSEATHAKGSTLLASYRTPLICECGMPLRPLMIIWHADDILLRREVRAIVNEGDMPDGNGTASFGN